MQIDCAPDMDGYVFRAFRTGCGGDWYNFADSNYSFFKNGLDYHSEDAWETHRAYIDFYPAIPPRFIISKVFLGIFAQNADSGPRKIASLPAIVSGLDAEAAYNAIGAADQIAGRTFSYGSVIIDLGVDAVAALNSHRNWFSIGIMATMEDTPGVVFFDSEDKVGGSAPFLRVEGRRAQWAA